MRKLRAGDAEVAFAIAAEVEAHNRELEKWNTLYEHQQAIAKLIKKAFRR